MKNAHPIVRATTSSPVGQDSTGLGSESAEPIIRLKLQKPLHWEWELTTSADALPVIQLLDKDGRLLVETTGRTAQRARGSFKKGLKTHEQFPVDESCANSTGKEQTSSSPSMSSIVTTSRQINRNIDGFSTKFGTYGFVPRKSRSDVDIKERRSKKRHLSTGEDSKMKIERNTEGAVAGNKKYSAGDYLRQQIMNDLRTRNTIGKTPEEIAKDRCKKVKAYLRSQSETLLSLVREEECDRDETKDTKIGIEKSPGNRSLNKSDILNPEEGNSTGENKKVKPYLRTRSAVIPMEDSAKNSFKSNEENRAVRKIKNDTNEEELTKIRTFLREKIQRRMNMEQARSRSAVNAIPESIENVRIRKRYSDYNYENDRKNYRTRKVRSETSILRFDPEMLEKEKLKFDKQMKREKSTNCRGLSEDFQLQRQPRNYRRSRSEVLVEALELDNRPKSEVKRESSSLERRKFYCKIKSDILLRQEKAEVMPMVSDENLANSPGRVKSQENVEKSWREYKERKKSEKYRRESERELPEEDFMSKPRWKDLQRELCSSRNCKICQNLRNCVNPLHEESRQESEELLMDKKAEKFFEETSTNNSRLGTSLQENYLLLEKKNRDSCQSSIIAESQVNNRDNNIGSMSALNVNSPNFADNTNLSKSAFKNYQELYARSNVKKSDTFKIVDGSEEMKEHANGSDMKINDGNDSDSDFGYLNGKGSLANKSNEDITKDYFKRVYELLKKRQEEMKKSVTETSEVPSHEDSSSSNYVEEIQRKRHRRKKKDKNSQGKIIYKKF